MRGSPVIQPVRTLKAVKSAVGDEVRHLEIFDYSAGSTGLILDPFTDVMWEATGDSGDILVDIFFRVRPTEILDGDAIEYELDQNGTWIDSTETWQTLGFVIFGPLPPIPTDVRIRYRRGSDVSPPSDVKTVDPSEGGPEG